ncbi:helix-turn-helix domain-containing protein [Streptomyces sp. ML-6]|uniref:helix-turn-helix transcriptional regulator n=1 Tax=Streptomyces sp. ML-6 TaxID=2982693 RepID=UPI0024BF9F8B|nr:helix-turn-helix domain-containing protein [Streptomyces sp. ML-6]MDK0525024.1 helix-turn-helix domain-containing protein [Streptomyces sp. ML-6]
MDLTGYLTSDEAAERLGINRQSLYNLAQRSPDFPKSTKVGRTPMWPKEGIDAWREKHPKRQTSKKTDR